MKIKMRQFAAGILAAALCFGAAAALPGEADSQDTPLIYAAASGDEYANLKIRVGLAYAGNSAGAQVAANLLNVSGYGSGYRFGYYDDQLDLVELGHTGQSAITMTKAQNLYLVGTTYYDEVPSGSYKVLGCYHLQKPGSYTDFESARAEADLWTGGFVAWVDGAYYVRINSYATMPEAQEAAALGGLGDWSVVWTSTYAVNVVVTGTTDILFQFDGGVDRPLGVMPGEDDSVETITWFRGFKYYGGFRYERLDGGNITVVNIVPLDTYVKGVVPYESVKTWPLEALKAQAVCARNYALTDLNRHYKYHFDVCNTTDCQVYYGAGSGVVFPSELTDRAVDETSGIYAWYEGSLAKTFFCSSNGGGTEDVKNVWGSSGYPYLTGVLDPYEANVADQATNYYWSYSYTKAELTEILQSKGYCTGTTVENFEVTEYSPTGNVLEMKFTYANGKSNSFTTVSSAWLRTKLGVRSIHFSVAGWEQNLIQEFAVNDGAGDRLTSLEGLYVLSGDGTVTQVDVDIPYVIAGEGEIIAAGQPSVVPKDTFVITGTGWGHNIGYSQWGGCAMANLGFTYDEILKFYFPGISVGPKS